MHTDDHSGNAGERPRQRHRGYFPPEALPRTSGLTARHLYHHHHHLYTRIVLCMCSQPSLCLPTWSRSWRRKPRRPAGSWRRSTTSATRQSSRPRWASILWDAAAPNSSRCSSTYRYPTTAFYTRHPSRLSIHSPGTVGKESLSRDGACGISQVEGTGEKRRAALPLREARGHPRRPSRPPHSHRRDLTGTRSPYTHTPVAVLYPHTCCRRGTNSARRGASSRSACASGRPRRGGWRQRWRTTFAPPLCSLSSAVPATRPPLHHCHSPLIFVSSLCCERYFTNPFAGWRLEHLTDSEICISIPGWIRVRVLFFFFFTISPLYLQRAHTRMPFQRHIVQYY